MPRKIIMQLFTGALIASLANAGQADVPLPIKADRGGEAPLLNKVRDQGPQNNTTSPNALQTNNPPQQTVTKPIIVSAERLPKGTTPPIPIIEEFTNETVNSSVASVLTTRQIESIKSKAGASKKAQAYAYPTQFQPKPVQRTIDVPIEPTREPRMIRMLQGSLTTWVFTDNDGNPWLIEDVSFDQELFASPDIGGEKASNIVSIQPKEPYALGNIRFKLEGRSTPIIMRLSTGYSNTVDDRIDVRVEGKNPAYKPKVVAVKGIPSHDPNMSGFLDGQVPKAASKLKVSDNAGQAWMLDGFLYFRTQLTVLSPAFTNYAASADGVKLYKFLGANPRLLVSDNGEQVFISLDQ